MAGPTEQVSNKSKGLVGTQVSSFGTGWALGVSRLWVSWFHRLEPSMTPIMGFKTYWNILLQMNEVLIYRLESIEVREGRIFLKG
jgi:hypothetical protein